ncbi:FCD domain-containing protein [Shimia sp. Alg240-R146]|uniref:FCD domain-containing protein n=1 Tax=Shimia sp. Alg240-R146 TaxID=2993449 RepID=UPI0022DF8160|nr:FCD domain-containing protein [Shimia sp. Alg240-R146]
MQNLSEATQKKRAADRLIRTFEQQILDGTLKDGDPLPPEREIVQEYGVSRTVVREAVVALSNKGLVEAKPRFRPVVRKPGYDTAIETVGSVVESLIRQSGGVRNLFDLRIMMEVALVREAALSANRDQISQMKEALAANEAAIDDSELFYETDVDFHGVLYQIPDNAVLPSIHKAYTGWLSHHWRQMPRLPDRNRINFESHSRIFEAILHRDSDEAERALRKHMADAWRQVRATFGEI